MATNRSEHNANAQLRATATWREGQVLQAQRNATATAKLWAARAKRDRAVQKRSAFWVRIIMCIITVIIFTTLVPMP